MPKAGWSDEQCLDFDLALVWFDGWVQAKRDEVTWVTPGKEHEGKVPKPKYPTLDAVLNLYRTEVDPDARFGAMAEIESIDLNAIIAGMHDGPSF